MQRILDALTCKYYTFSKQNLETSVLITYHMLFYH